MSAIGDDDDYVDNVRRVAGDLSVGRSSFFTNPRTSANRSQIQPDVLAPPDVTTAIQLMMNSIHQLNENLSRRLDAQEANMTGMVNRILMVENEQSSPHSDKFGRRSSTNVYGTPAPSKQPGKSRDGGNIPEGNVPHDERRSSSVFLPEFNSMSDADASSSQYPRVLTTEYVIPVSDMMDIMSIKSYLRLTRIYIDYHNTALDKSKRMIYWCSEGVRKTLVNSEKLLEIDGSRDLNIHTILSVSNGKLVDYFARALRPKTKEEYKRVVCSTIGLLVPDDKRYGEQLVVKRYHDWGLFKRLDLMCTAMEDVDSLIIPYTSILIHVYLYIFPPAVPEIVKAI